MNKEEIKILADDIIRIMSLLLEYTGQQNKEVRDTLGRILKRTIKAYIKALDTLPKGGKKE